MRTRCFKWKRVQLTHVLIYTTICSKNQRNLSEVCFSVILKGKWRMDWFMPVDELAEWLGSFGIWAIFVSLLLSIIIAILGIVPTLFLSGANAVVFGLIPGFWISLTGEVLGAGVSFWLYRRGFGRIRPVKQESWVWLKRLNEVSRKRRAVILFLARLTPLIPSGVITFAAAVSHMRFWDFIMVTFIGKMPSILMETLIGHDVIRIEENYPRLLLSLLFLAFIYILMRKKRMD